VLHHRVIQAFIAMSMEVKWLCVTLAVVPVASITFSVVLNVLLIQTVHSILPVLDVSAVTHVLDPVV